MADIASTTLTVPGITCDHCKSSIEGALGGLDGVRKAEVSVPEKTVSVDYDPSAVSIEKLRDAIVDQGYDLPA